MKSIHDVIFYLGIPLLSIICFFLGYAVGFDVCKKREMKRVETKKEDEEK